MEYDDIPDELIPEGYDTFTVADGDREYEVRIETFSRRLPVITVNGEEMPFRAEFMMDWQRGFLDDAIRRYLREHKP